MNPNLPRDRADARSKAESVFQVAEARTKLVKDIVAAENALLEARTAKLRALRLAKEAEESAKRAAAPRGRPRSRTKPKAA